MANGETVCLTISIFFHWLHSIYNVAMFLNMLIYEIEVGI